MRQADAHYLLEEATMAVAQNTDVQIELLRRETQEGNRRSDANVLLKVRGLRKELRVEIKTHVNNTTIAYLANALGAERHDWLFVTTHVTPPAAQKLRALRIQFIDVAGNAYIDLPGAYVFIQGRKLPDHWERLPAYDTQWTRAGVKVVFAILRDPDLANAPYRELAKRARVALGTVAGIMHMLIRRGFIHEIAGGRQIRNRKQLLDTWTVAYAEKLRPKTLLGTFRMREELAPPGRVGGAPEAQWGGEVAAARLTQYLKPQVFTIYTNTSVAKLLVALKLVRDPVGNCEVRRTFWRDETDEHADLVPTVLVYADLLATADARNVEAAQRLYDEHVRRHLQID